METTAPAPTEPAPTEPETDGAAAYRLGMLAWFLAWVASMVGMCYSLANPGSPVGFITWAVLGCSLLSNLGNSFARAVRRKKRVRSDAAVIADPMTGADERQWLLNSRSREFAGIMSSYGMGVLFVFLGIAAARAGIRVDSVEKWTYLSVTVSIMVVVTHTIVMKMAARYYSRKG